HLRRLREDLRGARLRPARARRRPRRLPRPHRLRPTPSTRAPATPHPRQRPPPPAPAPGGPRPLTPSETNVPATWPCRRCGGPAELHDEKPLTIWYRCEPCSTPDEWALTAVPRSDLADRAPAHDFLQFKGGAVEEMEAHIRLAM